MMLLIFEFIPRITELNICRMGTLHCYFFPSLFCFSEISFIQTGGRFLLLLGTSFLIQFLWSMVSYMLSCICQYILLNGNFFFHQYH